jgi:translation initiation factor IF-1
MLGAATMMVMLVGTVVVTDHVSGRLNMDGMSTISQSATAR